MKTEVNERNEARLSVLLEDDDLEHYVRRTMNLDDDWIFEETNFQSDGTEVVFTKYGSDTRECP